jgi:hypothetical protein
MIIESLSLPIFKIALLSRKLNDKTDY